MQTLRFGDYIVDAISDGCIYFDPMGFFPDVPQNEVSHACAAHGLGPGEKFGCYLTSYLIRRPGRTILVDTGVGPDQGRFQGTVGLLPAALAVAGVETEEVDTVLFTHLHVDHVGWNFTEYEGGQRPTFPNARYLINRVEWERWSGFESNAINQSVKPLADTGQLELVGDGYEPAPGVRLLATPGHTAGHIGILIYGQRDGQGEGGIIAGDIAHHPMELEHPDWSPRFDDDRAQAARTRAALVERAEAEGLVVLGGHLPPPHAGRIVRVEQRRVYQPLRS